MLFFVLVLTTITCVLSDPPIYPWITRSTDCGFDYCVVVDFTQVPTGQEFSGSSPDFPKLFLLQPSEGPQPGTDPPNCVPETPVVQCLFSESNVRVYQSQLELTVPGPTPPNGIVSVAMVSFFDPFTSNGTQTLVRNGFFEVIAQAPDVPGTCVGIFTQAIPPPPVHWDEQDIEILTGHYTKPDRNVSAGLEITSWNAFPKNNSDREINYNVPYGFNPPSDFFPYSIFWNNQYTVYTWGDQSKRIDKYSSQNPSAFSINNWSDGGYSWSQGPPVKTSVLRVRKITAKYNM